MSPLRSAILSLSVVTLICAGRAQTQATDAAPSYASDPKFVSAMADAGKLAKQRQYLFALDAVGLGAGSLLLVDADDLEAAALGEGVQVTLLPFA